MLETMVLTLTELITNLTGAIVIISEDALTFLFWNFEDGFKWAWMVFFCLEILLAGGGITLKPSCLLRFLLSVELGPVSKIAGAAREVRVGTNSSSAGETEMLGTIADDMRGC